MKNEKCFVCGTEFGCGATDATVKCWCAELPNIVPFSDKTSCLCQACLKAKIEVIEAYNAVSKTYADKYSDEILLKPQVQEYLARFAKTVPEEEVICDMGCGPGQVARYLHNNLHRKAEGIDLSPKMAEIASALNPGINFRCADILQLDETELYGGIIGLYFIVNFSPSTLPLVFKKLNQLLKPNGELLLSFHKGCDELKRVDSLWDSGKGLNFYFFNPATISKYLTDCGFKVTDIQHREPNPAIEFPSQRAYVFAEKIGAVSNC